MHGKQQLSGLAFELGSELAKSIQPVPEYGWPQQRGRDNTRVFVSIMSQDVLKEGRPADWQSGHGFDWQSGHGF